MLAINMSLDQRVQNGINLLDREFPGWEGYVSAAKLNICDGQNCVLGQLGSNKYNIEHGAYAGLCKVIGLSSNVYRQAEFGFLACKGEEGTLNKLWAARIRAIQRQKAIDSGHPPVYSIVELGLLNAVEKQDEVEVLSGV